MRLQFRLLQNERLNCSDCGEIMEYGANVYIIPDKDVVLFICEMYIIPDKDVVLFICEMCYAVKVDEDRLALRAGNRRIAR
jgi:hypothetical protein